MTVNRGVNCCIVILLGDLKQYILILNFVETVIAIFVSMEKIV